MLDFIENSPARQTAAEEARQSATAAAEARRNEPVFNSGNEYLAYYAKNHGYTGNTDITNIENVQAIMGFVDSRDVMKQMETAKFSFDAQGNPVTYDVLGNTMPKFANGGIANKASIFGEAGAEAAVPLPDGRSIPVTLYNASNDSSVNSAETIAELKSQNQKLEILVKTMMATSKAEREKTQELIDAMNGLRTDTRLKAKG